MATVSGKDVVLGVPERARLWAGIANPCTPPEAYTEKAVEFEAPVRLAGDLLRAHDEDPPRGGDFARLGNAEPDAKASNPDAGLLDGVAVVEGVEVCPNTGAANGELANALAGGDLEPENILWPFTAANGELADA